MMQSQGSLEIQLGEVLKTPLQVKLKLNLEDLPVDSLKIISVFLHQCVSKVGEEGVMELQSEFRKLFKSKLNKPNKIKVLKDKYHRSLIFELIKEEGIQYYSYSYFNQAKITAKHLEYLKEIGPYLFVEAVMLVSKLNVINKNYSRILTENNLYSSDLLEGAEYVVENSHGQSYVDIKICNILKLCDVKKRSVNNNLNKLDLLLEDVQYRIQIIKELGKILRDSWKKEKESQKNGETFGGIHSKKEKVKQMRLKKQGAQIRAIEKLNLIELNVADSSVEEGYEQDMKLLKGHSIDWNESAQQIRRLDKEQSVELVQIKSQTFESNSSIWGQEPKALDFI